MSSYKLLSVFIVDYDKNRLDFYTNTKEYEKYWKIDNKNSR